MPVRCDISGIPALYLWGPNKMGHLRDASVEQIENRLFDKTYLREDGFCG